MNPTKEGKSRLLYIPAAVAAFHLAYSIPGAQFLALVYLFCLLQLARATTTRGAFYSGLTVGLGVFVPQTAFLWNIFSFGSPALWAVLSAWLGLFVALARLASRRFGPIGGAVLVPFLWTGLEYFRGEVYYLRFNWLSVGYCFSDSPGVLSALGIYGIGFLLMAVASALCPLPRRWAGVAGLGGLVGLALLPNLSPAPNPEAARAGKTVRVAAVQLEVPFETDLVVALDKLIHKFPQTQLVVLSEYTFQTPPPELIRAWCRRHKLYLVAGGKEAVSSAGMVTRVPSDGVKSPSRNPQPATPDPQFSADSRFYNTAFVVGPDGEIVFRQVKSVPIQFFRDGLPAPTQQVWDSPWGKLGVCICYDLSYRRVVDRLIQLGAQAILVPTMDELAWGRQEHEHHARVAPLRAAELGVPIFRVGSCGIPQLVASSGRVLATAPFPGEGAMIAGELRLVERGRLPLDHWLAPLCVVVTVGIALWFAFQTAFARWFRE